LGGDNYQRQTGRLRSIEQLLGSAPPRPDVGLSYAEGKKYLKQLKHDPFALQNGITLAAIAGVMGISRSQLDQQVHGTKNLRLQALTMIMAGIDSGDLCFIKKRGGMWITTPSRPLLLTQASVLDTYQWSYWKRCRTCNGRRFVRVDPVALAVCIDCTPDLRVLGGFVSKHQLLMPAEARNAA
jgi:hypothetical protein